MGVLIAVAILWFVLGRWRRRYWLRRPGVGSVCLGPGWGSYHGRGAGAARQRMAAGMMPPVLPPVRRYGPPRATEHTGAPRRESEFEVLKRQYVAGELTDEAYERELDALFRTESGRRQVHRRRAALTMQGRQSGPRR